VHLAEAYRRAGELEKARKVLNEGLERHSDYLSARIVLAQVETELGDTDRALEVWGEVTQLDPDNELALWALAELEYNRGNGSGSLSYYRRLAELGVDDAELEDMITRLESANPADANTSEGAANAGSVEEEPGIAIATSENDSLDRERTGGGGRRGGAPDRGSSRESSRRGASAVTGIAAPPAVPGTPRQALRDNGTALVHTDAIGLSDLLIRLLEYRDATFYADSSLTRLLAIAIGRELELDRIHVEALALAALLSDLGGLGLGSGNGSQLAEIDDETQRRIAEQREVAISLQLLHGIMLPAGVHEAVRHQHERWDGRGYPDGLKEEEIPYGARVIAIARACAALLTRHAHNGGVGAALEEIQRHAGSRYDPVVISVLRRVFQHRAEHGIGFGLGGRIVIAYPEELRGLDVATQLHAEGYVAVVTRDAAGARDSVRRSAPKAIVLGASLPGDDLVRFIREVRSSGDAAGIPLLVIDANSMDLRVDLLTAGADVCFATDVTFREFKATLDALLRRREEIDRPQDRAPRADARF
jgi:HD-GYP domain-containing protein (c-di-GMP phosphodiesterase class II)